MTPWIEAIALWMADFYLAATILLIIACSALCFLKQPARRMAVSWGALVSLLVAALLCQSASRPRMDLRRIFVRQERPPVRVETTRPRAADAPVSVIPFVPRQTAPPQRAILERPVEVVAEPEIAIDSPSAKGIDSRTFAGGAVFLFLIGAVLMAARLAVGVWQALRLVQQSAKTPSALVDDLRAIVGADLRLPRLRLNPHLVTPVATGALWPTIVLPNRFAQCSSRAELRAVLAHEWAHIRNGDLWLLALDRCLLPVLWAHPIYWWLRRRMRQDQEFLADAAAASLTGPADYAAQLVGWARDLAGVRPLVVSNSVGIWERPSGFALRISTVLNQADRMTLRCSGRVRAAVVGCLAAVSLAAASVSVRPPNAESAPPEPKAAPAETRAEPSKSEMLPLGADEIGGTCVDQQKAPVAGAQVFLYCVNWNELTQRLVQEIVTDESGQFKFTHLAPKTHASDIDIVFARRDGFATSDTSVRSRGKRLELAMPKAATFRGTIRDPKGKPIAGALVSFGSPTEITFFVRPIDGMRSARTDAKGEFAVHDLGEFTYVRRQRPPNYHGAWASFGPPSMTIVHPDYVRTRAQYRKVPGYLDVTLSDPAATTTGQVVGDTGRPAAGVSVALYCDLPRENFRDVAVTGQDGRYRFTSLPEGSFSVWVSASPTDQTAAMIESVKVHQGHTTEAPLLRLVKGGAINGRIVNDITGKPAAGITVNLEGIGNQIGKARGFFSSTRTDGQGQYRLVGLPGGKFNVFIPSTGLDATASALDSFEVRSGQTATAPPIHLIRGGLVKGRVIDDGTGKPVIRGDDEYLDVQIHGPSRPWSGGGVDVAEIRKDGTFGVRLPPGENWLALRTDHTGETFDETGNVGGYLTVPDGGEVEVEYHIKRMKPPKKADNKKVQKDKSLTVRVVEADGRPVSDAAVVACVLQEEATSLEKYEAKTDDPGTAALDVRGKRCRIVACTNDQAFAGQAVVAAGARDVTIKLMPAAHITGRLVATSLAPLAGLRLLCYLTEPADNEMLMPLETRTDAKGRFTFDGVPVGATARLAVVKPGIGYFREGVSFVVDKARALELGDVFEEYDLFGSYRGTRHGENWLPGKALSRGEMWDAMNAANADFAKAYALQAGQNVKHFDEPFLDARKHWVRLNDGPSKIERLVVSKPVVGTPNDPRTIERPPNVALTVHFHKGKVLRHSATVGGPGRVERSLNYVIDSVCGIPFQEIEGPKQLLERPIMGDFVVRLGVPAEELVPEFEKILWNECNLRVQLNFEEEQRNIVVAEGNFKLKPLAGQGNSIAIYGKTAPGEPDSGGGGGGSGDFDELLLEVGRHINRRIVSEVSTPPRPTLSWRFIGRGVFTQQQFAEDRDPQQMFKHLSEQTGLTFREETRTVRVLHVE